MFPFFHVPISCNSKTKKIVPFCAKLCSSLALPPRVACDGGRLWRDVSSIIFCDICFHNGFNYVEYATFTSATVHLIKILRSQNGFALAFAHRKTDTNGGAALHGELHHWLSLSLASAAGTFLIHLNLLTVYLYVCVWVWLSVFACLCICSLKSSPWLTKFKLPLLRSPATHRQPLQLFHAHCNVKFEAENITGGISVGRKLWSRAARKSAGWSHVY